MKIKKLLQELTEPENVLKKIYNTFENQLSNPIDFHGYKLQHTGNFLPKRIFLINQRNLNDFDVVCLMVIYQTKNIDGSKSIQITFNKNYENYDMYFYMVEFALNQGYIISIRTDHNILPYKDLKDLYNIYGISCSVYGEEIDFNEIASDQSVLIRLKK